MSDTSNEEKYREALEKIAYPITHLQKEAAKEGCKLDGVAAVSLAKDSNWLSSIAKKALE